MVGPDYTATEEEQAVYAELLQWDAAHKKSEWTYADFASIHTVGGFRSPLLPNTRTLHSKQFSEVHNFMFSKFWHQKAGGTK